MVVQTAKNDDTAAVRSVRGIRGGLAITAADVVV